MKKITVLGGGTGTFVVLSGLKNKPVDLGVIVTMMDSGGSTGRLRDQLGVLPPGDLRQCLVALSDAPLLWRKLFLYRFENGDLKGHNFGNIFLSALEKVSGDYEKVIKTVSYVLKTKGEVIPVTFEKTNLVAEYENGVVLDEETKIDNNFSEKSRIIKSYLNPEVKANPNAIKRLRQSDYIIVGPGDLYTSIIPVLLVGKIKETIKKSKAKIICILNLMTKGGQTANYTARDHLNDLSQYLGKQVDYILVNNGKIPADVLKWYINHDEKLVQDNLGVQNKNIIREKFISQVKFSKENSDVLMRSILRHDPKKIAEVLSKIIL